jgi:hypothetical protein
MVLPFRVLMLILALVTGVATSYSVFAEPIYDVLDGTGPSHKKVDVVEWEGNLEVHVYPKGSAAGLGVKLDDRTEGKKVMVIAYRFKGQKEVLVRRAILGVPFDPKLKGFVDPTEKDFDKLAISNQQMPAPWKPYKFDPAPKQWYPDGDERNNEDPANEVTAPVLGETQKASNRTPASAPEQTKSRPVDRGGEGSLNQYNW